MLRRIIDSALNPVFGPRPSPQAYVRQVASDSSNPDPGEDDGRNPDDSFSPDDLDFQQGHQSALPSLMITFLPRKLPFLLTAGHLLETTQIVRQCPQLPCPALHTLTTLHFILAGHVLETASPIRQCPQLAIPVPCASWTLIRLTQIQVLLLQIYFATQIWSSTLIPLFHRSSSTFAPRQAVASKTVLLRRLPHPLRRLATRWIRSTSFFHG